MKIEGTVETGQYLLLDHEGNATVTDQNYNVLHQPVVQGRAILAEGSTSIAFACDVVGGGTPEVVVRHITRGAPEKVVKH